MLTFERQPHGLHPGSAQWLWLKPHTVYVASRSTETLYVGLTGQTPGLRRLDQHHETARWWRLAPHIDLLHVEDRAEAIHLEAFLIHVLKPRFNRSPGERGADLEIGFAWIMDSPSEPIHFLIPLLCAADGLVDTRPTWDLI